MLEPEGRAQVILEHARRSGYRTLVETGSADGWMTDRVKDDFDRIYTVEIDVHSYLHCFRRFAPYAWITPIHGDSEDVLWSVMEVLQGPAVFWLDAHAPGGTRGKHDTPIQRELIEVMGRTHRFKHVLLIDDARLFGTDPAYPSQRMVQRMISRYDGYHFELKDDIMRVLPAGV